MEDLFLNLKQFPFRFFVKQAEDIGSIGKLTENGEEGQCGWLKDKYRTFVVSGTDGSFKINARPDKSRKGYESLSENDKFDIEKILQA
jgi:predicted 3-demethylubiquinone-9 3-methyltransferase (glyoxalase superfamily)